LLAALRAHAIAHIERSNPEVLRDAAFFYSLSMDAPVCL
jgi:hypothetical protein